MATKHIVHKGWLITAIILSVFIKVVLVPVVIATIGQTPKAEMIIDMLGNTPLAVSIVYSIASVAAAFLILFKKIFRTVNE